MRKKTRVIVGLLVSLGLVYACASGNGTLIEEGKFLMDSCKPTDATTLDGCRTTLEKMDEIQTTDPNNIDAAVLESSAHLGLAGFNSLKLGARLTGLTNDNQDDFLEFRLLVTDTEIENGREIDLAELDASKKPLTDVLTGITPDETNKAAFFQLGMLQGVDSFIRPVKIAGVGAMNVAKIDATTTTTVKEDFLNADNNMIASGTTKDDILRPLRENYCRCSLQTPLGATAGYTAPCLRDLMRCTLSGTAMPEQDYNGDGALSLGDCTTLRTPTALSTCGGQDTK
ncbi:MAG: hypothetical protein HYS22_06350 [Deltaproteobacteria bacterium]|nr:hypothetical protein [Deltaproteobacteria bacterium]